MRGGGESFESVQVNMDEYSGRGTTFDRVIANEHTVWVRMYVEGGNVKALAIMKDNNVLQTKYVAGYLSISLSSTSIGDLVHIVINNVATNMGIERDDAMMIENLSPTITINSGSYSDARSTWTSTIKPDNPRVELDCEVVDNINSVITAYCGLDQWSDSVFNRIPIYMPRVSAGAAFGRDGNTNHVLFGMNNFSFDGSVPSGWSQYDVDGSGSNLTIGNQFTIIGLPESFVSYWVNMGAKAWMGDKKCAMLVPPE